MEPACPICAETGEDVTCDEPSPDVHRVHCPRCGDVDLGPGVESALREIPTGDDGVARWAVLSHAVRKMQGRGARPQLDTDLLDRLLEERLPSIQAQREALVLFLGREGPTPGEPLGVFDARAVQATIGATTWRAVAEIGGHLVGEGRLAMSWSPTPRDPTFKAALTFDGWTLYEELLGGTSESRTAFMAMQFGDPKLDELVNRVFRHAVEQTGFELIRVDDMPRAGLIDDHIRVMIRTARFVLTDLTHDNPGAYWEAGFAEGLGRPVIYTCERSKFEEHRTHFDTNHQHTVLFEYDRPDEAARNLKATIRATLPSEASLVDPEA